MGRWISGLVCIAAAVGVLCGYVARSENVRYELDPARSVIELGGVLRALGATLPLREQGPGGLEARYAGFIETRLEEGSIEFIGGSEIRPLEEESWAPGPFGEEGSALASYGIRAAINIIIVDVTLNAASRDMLFDARSGPLPLTDGTFSTAQLTIEFAEGAPAAVDYRSTGTVNENGRRLNMGSLTNRMDLPGRLETVDGVETLTIPVDANYALTVESDDGPVVFDLDFIGELVAVRSGSGEDLPAITYMFPRDGSGTLNLDFPDTIYKLQRATQLEPGDWADFAETSPANVALEGGGAYFRVVPRD